MFAVTLLLLCLSVVTAVIGGLMTEFGMELKNLPTVCVGVALLAAGIMSSIYYGIAITQ